MKNSHQEVELNYSSMVSRILIFEIQLCSTYLNSFYCFQWAKRTKFLLAVIYGSRRRHLDSSKTFKKIVQNLNKVLNSVFRQNIFRQAESFKTMNQPDRNAL